MGRDGSFLCLPTIQMGSKSLKNGELVKGAIAIKNARGVEMAAEKIWDLRRIFLQYNSSVGYRASVKCRL